MLRPFALRMCLLADGAGVTSASACSMRRGWGATNSCGRHRRVDTAPSPWQTSWGGCAPWTAVRGRPGAASATCATCTCANAVIATRHPPSRAARPPSGHGRCRNPFGHPQRHNPFRVSAGRCAPAALGSSGASDSPRSDASASSTPAAANVEPLPWQNARPPAKLLAQRAQCLAPHTLAACGSGQLDRTCPTRLALASWARPSFLGTRVLAARCAASHAFCACPDLARGRRVRGA